MSCFDCGVENWVDLADEEEIAMNEVEAEYDPLREIAAQYAHEWVTGENGMGYEDTIFAALKDYAEMMEFSNLMADKHLESVNDELNELSDEYEELEHNYHEALKTVGFLVIKATKSE